MQRIESPIPTIQLLKHRKFAATDGVFTENDPGEIKNSKTLIALGHNIMPKIK